MAIIKNIKFWFSLSFLSLLVSVASVTFILSSCGNSNDSVSIKSLDIPDNYLHPKPEDVELKLSLEYKDTIHYLGRQLDGRTLMVLMGKAMFCTPTPKRAMTCQNCHQEKGSGTGFVPHAMGSNFQLVDNEIYEYTTGEKSDVGVDLKPFKNVTNLNSYLLNDFGRILTKGLEAEFPLEAQVAIALNEAHFGSDLVEYFKGDQRYQSYSYKLFGKGIDLQVIAVCLSAYQQTLTTWNNKLNQYARGEISSLKYSDGLRLLNEKGCNNCHLNGSMASTVNQTELLDTAMSPRLDANTALHITYFHNGEMLKFHKAIEKCAKHRFKEGTGKELSTLEKWNIIYFMRNNMVDSQYTQKG